MLIQFVCLNDWLGGFIMGRNQGRLGVCADDPRPSRAELFALVLRKTREKFPSCCDLFSEDEEMEDNHAQNLSRLIQGSRMEQPTEEVSQSLKSKR